MPTFSPLFHYLHFIQKLLAGLLLEIEHFKQLDRRDPLRLKRSPKKSSERKYQELLKH